MPMSNMSNGYGKAAQGAGWNAAGASSPRGMRATAVGGVGTFRTANANAGIPNAQLRRGNVGNRFARTARSGADGIADRIRRVQEGLKMPKGAESPSKWDAGTKRSYIQSSSMLLNGDVERGAKAVRAGDMVSRIILLVCLAVFIASGCVLANYALEVSSAEQQFDAVTNEFVFTGGGGDGGLGGEGKEDLSGLPPVVDWEGLSSINPEISGWIRIPGTTVDYPVLTSAEQDKYLHTDLYGNYSINGCIFTDFQNNGSDLDGDEHIVVYGHHMDASVMFHDVARYADPAYAAEHDVIYFETPDTTYVLKPIGVYQVHAEEYETRQVRFGNTGDFQSYLDTRLDRISSGTSIRDYDRKTMDKLFTLITCNNFSTTNDRIIVECAVEQEYPTSMVPSVIEGAREAGATQE